MKSIKSLLFITAMTLRTNAFAAPPGCSATNANAYPKAIDYICTNFDSRKPFVQDVHVSLIKSGNVIASADEKTFYIPRTYRKMGHTGDSILVPEHAGLNFTIGDYRASLDYSAINPSGFDGIIENLVTHHRQYVFAVPN